MLPVQCLRTGIRQFFSVTNRRFFLAGCPRTHREGLVGKVVIRLFLALACGPGAGRGFFVHGFEALAHEVQQR